MKAGFVMKVPNHVRPPLGGNTKDPGGVPSFCQIRAQLVFHLLVIPEQGAYLWPGRNGAGKTTIMKMILGLFCRI